MSNSLASSADAQLILRLYELRTERVMRAARTWVTRGFQPGSADEVVAAFKAGGSEESGYLRQVITYWEMAASFVLHGALSEALFVDCNPEPFNIYARFQAMLPEIRKELPGFFVKTGQLIETSPAARAQVDWVAQRMAAR